MADKLRGRLIPFVLCCVSGGLAVQSSRALADNLPPLQIDPALLRLPATRPEPAQAAPVASIKVAPPLASTSAPYPTSKAAAAVAGAFPAAPAAAPKTSAPAVADGAGAAPLASTQRLAATPSDGARPNFVSGGRIRTENSDTTIIEDNAELRRIGNTLKADKIIYRRNEDEVEATGNVHLTADANEVKGPQMRRKLDAATGFFDKPEYVLRQQATPGQSLPASTGFGHADRMEFEGENRYRLTNGTYTTCGPTDPDWYAKAKDLKLDYNAFTGEGSNATVYFKDVPFLYSPWLDFPLNNARKTGLLTPSLGTSSNMGLDLVLPWYWNIAPNMDATFTPHYMGRRGTQLGTEFRYLDQHFNSTLRYEVLPHDTIYGADRSTWSVLHNQNFGYGLTGLLNLNGASDKHYFADLSSSIAATSQSYMTKQAALNYGSTWWNASLGSLRYDPLQDVATTYGKKPYATLNASRPNFIAGTAFNFSGEFANFVTDNAGQAEGRRTVLYPQLSLPLVSSGFSLTPKLGYHVTRYSLDRVATAGDPTSISRSLPIFSLDASATFERDIDWGGKPLLQTLEPRLYYLRVRHVDQGHYPIFDSGVADFNFAQIFSENRYSGSDRIGDANQLTAAVTSRIIDPETGVEKVRGMLGQRYYFRNQTVALPTEAPRTSKQADVLAALSGQFLRYSWLDSGWRYNPRDRRTENYSLGVRYQPEVLKSLSASFRFRRESALGANDGVHDVDFSGQWPLFGRWYGVGRYNYSIQDKRLVETVAGLEYDGGCWVGRIVAQRYIAANLTSSVNANYNSGLFVQLELNGFSRIGTDPLEVLKRSVSGYKKIGDVRPTTVYGAE